jgi:hypothetical protein
MRDLLFPKRRSVRKRATENIDETARVRSKPTMQASF